MRRNFLLSMLVVALALTLGVTKASADSTLDFGIAAGPLQSGVLSYAGGASPLVGSEISVANVVGIGTPLNDGLTLSFDGVTLPLADLDFTSGANNGAWSWGPGGSISLDLEGGFGTVNILSGTWTSLSVFDVDPLHHVFKIVGGAFVDTKNADLAAVYGLPGGPGNIWMGNINLSFNATGVAPNAFTSTKVLSGDVTNTIPEPATLTLFGTGLLGLAGVVRRRFMKK